MRHSIIQSVCSLFTTNFCFVQFNSVKYFLSLFLVSCLHDERKIERKTAKKFICFYQQRKRNELRSRRNLLRFLELKLKNKQHLIKACLELLVQYVNIYHQHQNLHDGGRIRSCRRHYRNVGWWNTVNTLYNEERFKQAFRISRNAFHYILQTVGPAILKEDAGVGSISPDERLVITLYNLGRGDYNYTIGEMTGCAESMCRSLPSNCRDFVARKCCKAISKTRRGLSSSSYRYRIRVAIQVCFCCN